MISNSRSRSMSATHSSSVGSGPGSGAACCPARGASPYAAWRLFQASRRLASSRVAARFLAGSLSRSSVCSDGSSTIWLKITARAAASGRRAHHRCSVVGWPWRMDFSRAEATLIASRGRATSMSFFL